VFGVFSRLGFFLLSRDCRNHSTFMQPVKFSLAVNIVSAQVSFFFELASYGEPELYQAFQSSFLHSKVKSPPKVISRS
jgi:hypothetical protein